MENNRICKMLNIKYPIIMAPMFLVSNVEMIVQAVESGIAAAFPALNYRTDEELRSAIKEIKSRTSKPFGVNLIVNKSNPKFPQQLDTCVELGVGFFITSLGNPKIVIEKSHPKGIKVFCDVTNLEYAQKVAEQGADALIAVSSQAGGHAGKISPKELISTLKDANFGIPIVSAGGVATSAQLKEMLDFGADAVSVGTIFIASNECGVSDDYKQALVDYGGNDVVLTSNLSGSPLTVINTPYVQKVGTKANWLNRMMYKHKRFKKIIKLLVAVQGMNQIKKAAFGATYKTYFVAGPSIEHIKAVRPLKDIINDLIKDL
jgi:nitronate monooxygenase